jgi:hydrogenase expression/formation protein HypC
MQIESIDGDIALCSRKGISRQVNLYLMDKATLSQGDFVLVHVGYAIQKVNTEQARSTIALVDSLSD